MFCGTSQVKSTHQGSKDIQGYFDQEYDLTNPQGVTQNLDFTSKFPSTGLLIAGQSPEGAAYPPPSGALSFFSRLPLKPSSLLTPFFPPPAAGLHLDIGIG